MYRLRRQVQVSNPLPPAPQGFKPAGRVLAASFTVSPHVRRKHYTGRRLEGIRYERKVHGYLETVFPGKYVQSPWLKFFPAGGCWRWCQPDGLVIDPRRGRITIVEVKYQHTAAAWWQVKQLYLPVLSLIFPPQLWEYDFCEVVKWYDPATVFPEPVVLAHEVDMVHPKFKVHIWKQ